MTSKISVVLVEPQDDINIGNTVRALRNFGFEPPRLVNPKRADPDRISISAPRSTEFVAEIETFQSLDDAVADAVSVYALSARPRYGDWRCVTPSEAAVETLQVDAEQRVAFVFGREDRGLTNTQLDRCDTIVTIPTNPDYSSLNLGQAVLLQLWEIDRMRRESADRETVEKPLSNERMARLFDQIDRSLAAVEFYKYGDGEHIVRAWRHILRSANLSEREFAIVFGSFKEVESYLERVDRDDVRRNTH